MTTRTVDTENRAFAATLAGELLSHPDFAEKLVNSLTSELGMLNVRGVAAFLSCSQSKVRANPGIQALARDIPGIGKRWSARELLEMATLHPRAQKPPEIKIQRVK